MWKIRKAVIITNNDWVCDKYKGMAETVLLETYEEVLVKARDMIHNHHDLLTHPQAFSRQPNQTPYRSIIVHPNEGEDNAGDIALIEKALETYYQSKRTAPAAEVYTEKVMRDFKVLDASMMDSMIPRLFHLGTG